MKAYREKPPFRPITLVVENVDELAVLKSALYRYYSYSNVGADADERETAQVMREAIMRADES